MDGIAANRTPVAILKSLAFCSEILLDWKCLTKQVSKNDQTFICELRMEDKITNGKGASKKKAKQQAAYEMLLIVYQPGGKFESKEGLEELENLLERDDIMSQSQNKIKNPVDVLKIYCDKNKLEPPKYDYENVGHKSHDSSFIATCNFQEFGEVGTGKSKKMARSDAAYKIIQDYNEKYPGVLPCYYEEGEDDVLYSEGDEGQKLLNFETNENLIQKKAEFVENLVTNMGNVVKSLHTCGVGEKEESLEIISELCREQRIALHFISKPKADGKFVIMLQLTDYPVVQFYGSGNTMPEAKLEACFQTVTYIQDITK